MKNSLRFPSANPSSDEHTLSLIQRLYIFYFHSAITMFMFLLLHSLCFCVVGALWEWNEVKLMEMPPKQGNPSHCQIWCSVSMCTNGAYAEAMFARPTSTFFYVFLLHFLLRLTTSLGLYIFFFFIPSSLCFHYPPRKWQKTFRHPTYERIRCRHLATAYNRFKLGKLSVTKNKFGDNSNENPEGGVHSFHSGSHSNGKKHAIYQAPVVVCVQVGGWKNNKQRRKNCCTIIRWRQTISYTKMSVCVRTRQTHDRRCMYKNCAAQRVSVARHSGYGIDLQPQLWPRHTIGTGYWLSVWQCSKSNLKNDKEKKRTQFSRSLARKYMASIMLRLKSTPWHTPTKDAKETRKHIQREKSICRRRRRRNKKNEKHE